MSNVHCLFYQIIYTSSKLKYYPLSALSVLDIISLEGGLLL